MAAYIVAQVKLWLLISIVYSQSLLRCSSSDEIYDDNVDG